MKSDYFVCSTLNLLKNSGYSSFESNELRDAFVCPSLYEKIDWPEHIIRAFLSMITKKENKRILTNAYNACLADIAMTQNDECGIIHVDYQYVFISNTLCKEKERFYNVLLGIIDYIFDSSCSNEFNQGIFK